MRNPLIFLLLLAAQLAFGQSLQPHVVFEQISISGNKQTKARIILRELSIQEGDTVVSGQLEDLLKKNKQRLFNTTLFNEIILDLDTLSPTSLRLNIALKERWYIWPEVSVDLADRNFNVWWNEMNRDINRINLGVNLTHNNFRGAMEKLSIGGQIGYTQRLTLNYTRPYFDKQQKHGFGISAGLSNNAETYYITDSNKLRFAKSLDRPMLRAIEGAISYFYRPGYNTFNLVRLGFRQLQIDDSILQLNPNYFQNRSNTLQAIDLSYRLEINKSDNWIYPLLGNKTIINAALIMGLKGMNYQAFVSLEHGNYKRLYKKFFTSHILRGRVIIPQALPYALRGALGSKYEYVRGYEYYVIDGYQFGIFRNNLKYELINTPRLFRLPFRYLPGIPLRLYPKLFTDVGYANNPHPGNSFLNNRLLYSAGMGLDIISAYDFKLRVEYTINHLGQKGLFLHLNSE